MKITSILKGITGEFEVGRCLLAASAACAIFAPIGFELYELVWNGGHFDVTAWCLAYPGGLAALVTCGILGVASKEKSIAVARQTQAMPPLDDKGAGQ